MRQIGLFLIFTFLITANQVLAGSYIDNNNGTVTDQASRLVWQKSDDRNTRTWQESLNYCNSLSLAGFSDWHLPNIKELRSIVDNDLSYPSIASVFYSTPYYEYWSSTSDINYQRDAYVVDFAYGHVLSGYKALDFYVRCVRGGN